MKDETTRLRGEASQQLRKLLDERNLGAVFQPIFSFREGRIIGFEALVRGPRGSLLQTPGELFGAAAEEGVAVELNVLCVQLILRAFVQRGLEGSLFLNVSPQLILQRGFDRARVERFMQEVGIEPERVVIELTEDYPTVDFRPVRESLMLYRSMGFRVAIDDLGEGFASLRLWSELRPAFVKADKHFVTGVATDPVKAQFLRAIQHIAEHSGSLVIAEGIESAPDFKVVREMGVACAQGYFIGRPEENPPAILPAETREAQADMRLPVIPAPRLRAGTEPTAHELVRAVEPVSPQAPLFVVAARFQAAPGLAAIPVVSPSGVEGLVSRHCLDALAAAPDPPALGSEPCIEHADRTPIRVDAALDLSALAAILAESDASRLADGFVIVSGGRYVGMGAAADVIRALQGSRVLAARYTNPLTLLPGQVPINEHLERLLARKVPFTTWFIEVDEMRGLNDCEGFAAGDALIGSTARLLEQACEPGIDFAGHVAGGRFVILMQSEDWKARAEATLGSFPDVVAAHVPAAPLERGYFTVRGRDGRESVRPLPKLGIGILPVLPGVYVSRHEVVGVAKEAAALALSQPSSAIYVDEHAANAYPQSLLFGNS